jgi:hypothetical protein
MSLRNFDTRNDLNSFNFGKFDGYNGDKPQPELDTRLSHNLTIKTVINMSGMPQPIFEESETFDHSKNFEDNRFHSIGTPIRKVLSDDSFIRKRRVLGFTNPLTLNWFFSSIGTEYCHTYFWLAKVRV